MFFDRAWKSFADLSESDIGSARFSRFQEENFEKNLELAGRVRETTHEKDAPPAS